MKTYFYSGHVARTYGGKLTHEFCGLVDGEEAVNAFKAAYDKQLSVLESQGGTEFSHYITFDAFNVVEEK